MARLSKLANNVEVKARLEQITTNNFKEEVYGK